MWRLYQHCQRQVRVSLAGVVGLDYGVFLPLVRDHGWYMDTALALLGAIEDALTSRETPGTAAQEDDDPDV